MNPRGRIPAEALAWPKERFFWAAIPGAALCRPGVAPAGVLIEVEHELPVPIEALHVVVAPAEDHHHLIVCAARRSELAELASGTPALVPESVPEALPAPLRLTDLNLLVGEFLPRATRRRQVRRHALAMLVLLAVSLLVATGFERRARAHSRMAEEQILLAKRLELESSEAGSGRSLHQEVERLEAIQSAINSTGKPPSSAAVATLAALCAAWPTELPAQPQGFTVSSDSASLAVVVTGQARRFLESWRPPPGWRADEPRLTATGDLTRINLTLHPELPRCRP